MASDNAEVEALKPLRRQIDALDLQLVEMLNARSELANKIGQIKKRLGWPVYMPSREKEVLTNVMRANKGPLSESAIRRLFERVIDETRSLERQRYQDSPAE